MSTILFIIAGYLALDALLHIVGTGKTYKITPGHAATVAVVRSFMVTVLVIAALNGVTP